VLDFYSTSWQSPRTWQRSCFSTVTTYLNQQTSEPAVISAIMGAGKSLLISEVAACTKLQPNELIVVSTSTERLVRDLYKALRTRCGQYKTVGQWYGKRKKMAQVVVVCTPSMQSFSDAMYQHGKTCSLWIADEVHKTQCDSVLAAHMSLKPAHALGLTATAFRSDESESITLFKKQIFSYSADEAMKDGVVVPMQIKNYEGSSDDIDQACLEMIRESKGPVLTNASSIADAKKFAEFLSKNCTLSQAIHSGIPHARQEQIMNDLKAGTIKCVVHVNLLTEGADFPWLMCLTLRREVDSRVRFCQEVGRGMRACSELIWGKFKKTGCRINDPHDLFGGFQGITFKECLGEAPPKAELPFDILQPEESAKKISEADPPVAMAAIESAVRTIAVACVTGGITKQRSKVITKANRLKPSTEFQQKMLVQFIERAAEFIPEGWRIALEEISKRPDCIRFGFAQDLISSLEGIRLAKRWPNVDAQGRISGMMSEVQEPTLEPLKLLSSESGQTEVDFSAYCESVRNQSIQSWARA
jgi:hypothetical protein